VRNPDASIFYAFFAVVEVRKGRIVFTFIAKNFFVWREDVSLLLSSQADAMLLFLRVILFNLGM